MSITLAQARERVRFFVDDAAQVIASDTQVDAALTSAQQEAFNLALSFGSSMFSVEASWTCSTSGVITLQSGSAPYFPARVLSLTLVEGNGRYQIPPSRSSELSGLVSEALSGKILYVPRVTFPTASGNSFVWGHSSLSVPPLDEYMCVLAAQQIKINESEINPALERRAESLQRTIESFVNPSSFSAMAIDDYMTGRRSSRLVWVRTAYDSIQLGYP